MFTVHREHGTDPLLVDPEDKRGISQIAVCPSVRARQFVFQDRSGNRARRAVVDGATACPVAGVVHVPRLIGVCQGWVYGGQRRCMKRILSTASVCKKGATTTRLNKCDTVAASRFLEPLLAACCLCSVGLGKAT